MDISRYFQRGNIPYACEALRENYPHLLTGDARRADYLSTHFTMTGPYFQARVEHHRGDSWRMVITTGSPWALNRMAFDVYSEFMQTFGARMAWMMKGGELTIITQTDCGTHVRNHQFYIVADTVYIKGVYDSPGLVDDEGATYSEGAE